MYRLQLSYPNLKSVYKITLNFFADLTGFPFLFSIIVSISPLSLTFSIIFILFSCDSHLYLWSVCAYCRLVYISTIFVQKPDIARKTQASQSYPPFIWHFIIYIFTLRGKHKIHWLSSETLKLLIFRNDGAPWTVSLNDNYLVHWLRNYRLLKIIQLYRNKSTFYCDSLTYRTLFLWFWCCW